MGGGSREQKGKGRGSGGVGGPWSGAGGPVGVAEGREGPRKGWREGASRGGGGLPAWTVPCCGPAPPLSPHGSLVIQQTFAARPLFAGV